MTRHYHFGQFLRTSDISGPALIRNYGQDIGPGESGWNFLDAEFPSMPKDFLDPQISLEEMIAISGPRPPDFVSVFVRQRGPDVNAVSASSSWGSYPYGTSTAVDDNPAGPWTYKDVENAGIIGSLGLPGSEEDDALASFAYMRAGAGPTYLGDPTNDGTDILVPWSAFASDPVISISGITDTSEFPGWFEVGAIPWWITNGGDIGSRWMCVL